LSYEDALQSLFTKILSYRITRNIDKELKDKNINHLQLSEASGRFGNWFNRTYNQVEDMRLSTFLRAYVAVSRIPNMDPLPLDSIFTEEVLKIASLKIDFYDNNPEDLIKENKLSLFLLGLKVYVDALEKLNIVTTEEVDAYDRVLLFINLRGTI